ncbi:MAG: hypothetical protein AAGE52_08145 [Myxococcota bacterium]
MRWIVLAGLLACGGVDEDVETPGSAEAEEESDEGAEPTAETPRPAWFWEGEPGHPDPNTTEVRDAGGLACAFTKDGDLRRLACRNADGSERWFRATRGVHEAALAQWGEVLVVATFTRNVTGATVAAYDIDTGAERWHLALTGLGPIDHSRWTNAVQIRRDPERRDRIVVAGWESQGKYLEILDPTRTGFRRRETNLWRESEGEWEEVALEDPASTWVQPATGVAADREFAWEGEFGASSRDHREEIQAGDLRCVWQAAEDLHRLECKRGQDLRWGFRVADDPTPGAVLAADDQRVYLARYHPIASGCVVYAYDRASGTELWRRGLWGVGEVTHSAYENRVQMRLEDSRLLVFGWESADRYLEILNVTTGAVVGHRSFGHASSR